VFAYRGYGKTWFLETLALVVAYGVEALGLRTPEPAHVLYVDGEMASEDVKQRFALLCEMLRVPRQLGLLADRRLVVVGADWQEAYLPRLDTLEGQMAIEPFVKAADLIVLDNRSSLFDPEGEKDPTAWQPAQEWLLSLRRKGKTTLTAHHANRLGGARGLSKAEDVIDLNLKLSRPDDYSADQGARFLVEFDKARGVHGPAAAPFVAALKSEGWRVEGPKRADDGARVALREYLRLAEAAQAPPKSANAALGRVKVNRNAGLAAWGAMLKAGEIEERKDGYYLREADDERGEEAP
jgi:putative DNA primase/helicase